MESEHSGIFRVELVTKNVVLGSSGTHFMHMRVKVFVKNSDILAGIYFIFLKKALHQTCKAFNIKFGPQWKYR